MRREKGAGEVSGRGAMVRAAALLGIGLLGIAAPVLAVGGQGPARLPRIGFLSPAGPATSAPIAQAFRQALEDVGQSEGRSVAVEYRWADGQSDRFPVLAAELVGLKVDLLVAVSTQGALAAKNATRTIPIVFGGVGDPVGTGLVAGLGRPGGNITGVASVLVEGSAKVLEVLREAVPGTTRVAVLAVTRNPAIGLGLKELEGAARALGVKVQFQAVRDAEGLPAALAAIARGRPGALVVFPDSLFFAHRARLVEFAAKQRLPAIYPAREYVEAGGLMSYGANFPDLYRRVAAYVEKILRGARPGDLPVEQPTRFELTLNLKTARALGLPIPQSVLIRADQVIR